MNEPKKDKKKRSRLGQVVVEMLLILPVFLTIVFTIMEMGHVAFWVLVLNHMTYECARIGAMQATGPTGVGPRPVDTMLNNVKNRFLPAARISSFSEQTLNDPQSNQRNHDLVVTGEYDVQLVFPISSLLLSEPRGSGKRKLLATVRMPIEAPQLQ